MQSLEMASRGHNTSVEARYASARSRDHLICISKSTSSLLQAPSQSPQTISLDEVRQKVAIPCNIAGRPSPSQCYPSEQTPSAAYNRLSELRHSQRWAKFHGLAVTKTEDLDRDEQDLSLTMREASFEQQRAQPRTSLQSPRSLPRPAAKGTSETDSFMKAGDLCKILSVPTWQVTRKGKVSHSQSISYEWLPPKLSFRWDRRSASRQSADQEGGELIPSPPKPQVRGRLQPKKVMSGLRRKAGFASSMTMPAGVEKVVDLDSVRVQIPTENRSNSPVPSLHDVAKVRQFSQECEAILSNAKLDKDWLSKSAKPSAPLLPLFEPAKYELQPGPFTNCPRSPTKPRPANELADSKVGPDSAMEARKHPETLSTAIAPKPCPRTSSKGGARLACLVDIPHPACLPIFHGFREGESIGLALTGNIFSTIRPNHPTEPTTQPKMSPAMAKVKRPPKESCAVANTGTLSMADAYIPDTDAAVTQSLKQSTAFRIDSQNRPWTRSETPSERPVPALSPPEIERRTSSDVSRASAAHRKGPRSTSMDPTRKFQKIAAARGLMLERSYTDPSTAGVSLSLPRPSSTYRQSLAGSYQLRYNGKERFCPESPDALRKGMRNDRARERRNSEGNRSDFDPTNLTDRPLRPVPPAERYESVNPSDQVPSVTIPRPGRRASVDTNKAQSRSRTHGRHSSHPSSMLARHAPQPLVLSDIKAIGDKDPVAGSFPTGAISPSSSITGNSCEGRIMESRRGLLNTGRRTYDIYRDPTSFMDISSTKCSIHSLHSQASSRQPVAFQQQLHRGSTMNDVESENGTNPVLGLAPFKDTSTRKHRQQVNTNDLQKVRKPFGDTETLYKMVLKLDGELRLQLKKSYLQKEEISMQRDLIQKTIRVFAPMSHATDPRDETDSMLHENPALQDKANADPSCLVAEQLKLITAARGTPSRSMEMRKMTGSVGKLQPISNISSTSAITNATRC